MGKAQNSRRKSTKLAPVRSGRQKATAAVALRRPSSNIFPTKQKEKAVTLSRGQRKRAVRKENFRQKASFAAAMVGMDDPSVKKSNPYFGFVPVQGDRVGPISAAANRANNDQDGLSEDDDDEAAAAAARGGDGGGAGHQNRARPGDTSASDAKVEPSAMQLPRHVRDGIEFEEVAQLKKVVGHQKFRANPFGALQFHLHNTLPPPEVPKNLRAKKSSKKKNSTTSSSNNKNEHSTSGQKARKGRRRR